MVTSQQHKTKFIKRNLSIKIFNAKSKMVCILYCIWRQRWRSYAIMRIQWGQNLHNRHKSSCYGLFFRRFNGTLMQKVRGRSHKLLWTASILGACLPGKLGEMSATDYFRRLRMFPDSDNFTGHWTNPRMCHVCSEVGCKSNLVRGST